MALNFIKLFILKCLLFLPLSIKQLIDTYHDKKNKIIPLRERYGIECYLGLAR